MIRTALQLFEDGGAFMWPLLLCAMIGLIVMVWKFISLMIAQIQTKELLSKVNEAMAERRFKDAINLCRESQGPVSAILLAGLEKHEEGSERVLKAIENAGTIELAMVERGLVPLATLANVSPLLGFLGTVAGMIQAFGAIELAGEVDATLVAGGIKVALITTATGLAIAIPINIAHNYFVTRVDRLILDMEESAQNILDILHETDKARAASQPH